MADEQVKPVDKNIEADLIKGHTHGVDETGRPAPDQADQAKINQEKLADPNKRDPRWPAGAPIKAIPADDAKHVQALNKEFAQNKKEAAASDSRNNPVMGGGESTEK